MALPEGVTQASFDRALRDFEKAVGSQWVFTSDADVALYRDAYSPFQGEPEERTASAAVAPNTVEEVQAVVRAANTHKIPLYTISTGKNLGYGGSAPNLSGSVVLDLKRMNRILDVSARRARRELLRFLSLHPRAQAQGMDGLPGSRLGQPDRQRARSRRRLHDDAVPQSLRCALRDGSGARERRAAAHRHGRGAECEDLAAVQVRRGPMDRRALL